MTSLAAVGLLIAACVGAGSAILALFKIDLRPSGVEHAAWSFALGLGTVGWFIFFPAMAGRLDVVTLIVVLTVLASGIFLPSPHRPRSLKALPLTPVEWLLVAGLMVSFGMSMLEGISPPTDADSLAYHFALPKQFLIEGQLAFVPRALDGATPLLIHMTYTAALGLGGEKALTLWVTISGWGAGALLYSIARRHLDRSIAGLLALSYMTIPVLVYGAGSGQVETRLAIFAMVAMWSAARAVVRGRLADAGLAGLASGFFLASKLTGILFVVCCGAVLLFSRRRFAFVGIFAAVVAISGFQWYAWNWANSGDPLFPLLFKYLGVSDPALWNARQDELFHSAWNLGELPLAQTLWGAILYPVLATFDPVPGFEAGRVGWGPLPMLLVPFFVAGVARFWRDVAKSDLACVFLVASLFYLIWFLFGPSQRVRHLAPIMPGALIVLTVVAWRWAASATASRPLAAAFVLTAVLQIVGQGVYSVRYAAELLRDETRESFLNRYVLAAAPIAWVNSHLPPDSRILNQTRHNTYLVDRWTFYAHPVHQAVVNLRPDATAQTLFADLSRLRITHIISIGDPKNVSGPVSLSYLANALIDAGCATLLKTMPVDHFASRTLTGLTNAFNMPISQSDRAVAYIAEFTPITCRLSPR